MQVLYLTVAQLAELAEITFTSAKLAVRKGRKGETWRGVVLAIQSSHGRGGAGGRQSLIRLDSLPAELQMRAAARWPEIVAALVPTQAPLHPVRKRRRDRGVSRVIITNAIDKALSKHLDRDQVAAIGRDVDSYVKSSWASELSRPGWRTVAAAATFRLHELCCAAGIPQAALHRLAITRHYVEDFDRRKHNKTNVYLNDAKKFHDAMPAVARDWSMLARPMELAIGDGTALDVRVLRPDGGEWKVWLILWLDGLTGRLFGHPYARPKGGGVKQDHIAYSFAVLASEIGLPETLMIDNGSEYGAVAALDSIRVVTSLPYAARSKPIEAAIRVLVHKHIALIPGYIGSDRMRKKTQSVGQPRTPYPNSMHELFADIDAAIAGFNATPRRRLGGISPNAAWQAHIEAGWKPRRADMDTMLESMARIESRVVKKGCVEIGGVAYTSDALMHWALEGERVTVAVPRASDCPPAVYDPKGRFVGLVHEKIARHPLDPAGARDAARMKVLRRKSARELAGEAPPVEIAPFQQAFLAANPPPDAPHDVELLVFADERVHAVEARQAHRNGEPVRRRYRTALHALAEIEDDDEDSVESSSADDTIDNSLGLKE